MDFVRTQQQILFDHDVGETLQFGLAVNRAAGILRIAHQHQLPRRGWIPLQPVEVELEAKPGRVTRYEIAVLDHRRAGQRNAFF